ncbi:MAG TPA: FAD-binding oxidoreductase [Candidatus Krumholzibacteria bacterium]|nr:FAD-binding oxidoreductase [Candidatus Krumholzibacteria bacterium]
MNAVATKLGELKMDLAGELILPPDPGYDEARAVWNAMIDRRPAMIVRCASTADVVRAVNYARNYHMLVSVRGGGHNVAGSAVNDGGMVIDMSRMKAVRVDAGARRAVVEAGALLSDVDRATQAHGLATPFGVNSTTGVAGLTLGGGFGWLSRKHGMTVDNLVAAEIVTAQGEVLHVSRDQHPDLFWALRGGSGNFGVVTRFEYQLHELGPEVLSGLIVYPMSDAKSVLQRYRTVVANAPEDLTVWAIMRNAPPLPFLPENVHGKGVVVVAFMYAGDSSRGEALVDPLRKLGTPVGEHVGVQPYTAWQQAFDPLLAPGARNYWKSHNFAELDDALLDVVIDSASTLPSPHCELFLVSMGGATSSPSRDETAYAHRDARFVINVHSRWETPAEDDRCIAWAREFFRASARFATGGVYVNFQSDDEKERVRAAYGSNYNRLARVKRAYDPGNLFRVNQNILPE